MKGDDGKTRLRSGRRVAKYHLRPEACGSVDEANAFLGVARSIARRRWTREVIRSIQEELLIIGAELATEPGALSGLPRRIEPEDVERLEGMIARLRQELPSFKGFVVPGKTQGSAVVDVARTVVRRSERVAAKLNARRMLRNPHLLSYLNRLSELLFLLARYEEA